MFDGITKNMLTDLIRGVMIYLAGTLGLSGNTRDQFIAGGLAVFAGVWAWYENKGHQLIVDALKQKAPVPPGQSITAHAQAIVGALALLFIVCGSAFAADLPLPVKAPALPTVYPYDVGGFYFGVNTFAGVEQNTVTGNPTFVGSLVTGNLNAAGGAVGGTIGYTKGNAAFWWAVEDSLDYQNITAASTTAPISTVSRWSNETVFKLHGFNPLAYLPNLGISLPTFPTPPSTGIATGAAQLYFGAGAKEFGINGSFAGMGGTTVGIAPLLQAGSLAQIVDANGKPVGPALDLGGEIVFSKIGKTLTINDGPLMVGNVQTGNQYWAYAKVLW